VLVGVVVVAGTWWWSDARPWASVATDGPSAARPAASSTGSAAPTTSASSSVTPSASRSTARPSPSRTTTSAAAPTSTRAPSSRAPATSSSPAPTTPPATGTPAGSSPAAEVARSASEAKEVLRLTNAERTAEGCSALAWDSRLAAAAAEHSADMARHDYFSHTSLDGRSFSTRISAAGYSWSRVAENIASGHPTPAAVVASWMTSEGHRANILDCRLTELGVGVARSPATGERPYWTQDFGTPG
jgi:uncharacterized protein YkwD